MINAITSYSQFLYVTYSPGAHIPSGSDAGHVRFNTNNQSLEAYHGSGWVQIGSGANVALAKEAEDAIAWAIRKKAEDEDLERLCALHPGLRDAKEKFEIMKALVKE